MFTLNKFGKSILLNGKRLILFLVEQQRSQDEAFIDRSIEHHSTEGMALFHTLL
jgi:hypothetical protein